MVNVLAKHPQENHHNIQNSPYWQLESTWIKTVKLTNNRLERFQTKYQQTTFYNSRQRSLLHVQWSSIVTYMVVTRYYGRIPTHCISSHHFVEIKNYLSKCLHKRSKHEASTTLKLWRDSIHLELMLEHSSLLTKYI
jgi:hypothetical protein